MYVNRFKTNSLEKIINFFHKKMTKFSILLRYSLNRRFCAIFEVQAHSKMGFNHTKFIKIYRNTHSDMGFQKKHQKAIIQ